MTDPTRPVVTSGSTDLPRTLAAAELAAADARHRHQPFRLINA
ncbi:MAG: hypothetical protein QOJ50_3472 [Cryptosporangiaceae bacterium]|jgi:hypothetical protein|nr:hypothetical protein [Cryptosporangiaceae bacterium]